MQKIPVKSYGIRGNVILGFIFAFLAVAAAGYLTYINTQKLVGSVLELSEPNPKLIKIREVFSDLTEAESNLRVYALIKENEYFNNYLQYINKVTRNIDSLKTITSGNLDQHKKINLIATLLRNRLKNVDDFVGFKQSADTMSYTLKALERLQNTPYDSTRTHIYTRTSTTISTIDTLSTIAEPEPREEQSRGFFTRVADFFSGKDKKVEEATQKVQQVLQETKVVRDTSILVKTDTTLLTRIRKVLAELKEEESRMQKSLHERELELLRNNSLIISKVMDITVELEQAELELMDQKTDEAREVASHSVVVLSAIMLSSLFAILLFTFLIMRNLSRSNFYRDQLFMAKQRAEELAHAKEEFLANMSHEMRTPLNSIIGFSEQLAKTALSNEQSEQLSAVHHSSEHLLALVNDILDFSKIEQGKLKLENIPFNLKAVILETYMTFRIRAREKKIRLSYNMQVHDDVLIVGDPLRLKQVLFNLVGNAVKFTERGEVKIICRSLNYPTEVGELAMLRFEVHDTGIGITTEKLDTIFDGFTQADSSLTRKYGGTGLGLTISKRLVEMQQGIIGVESEYGKGSMFSVEIPFMIADPESQPLSIEGIKMHSALLKGKWLLLVEDDELNVKLTTMILEQWGIKVDSANSGAEALDKIAVNDYDLVLTDIHMPDMSGVEMTQRIRTMENPDKASLPIIAITANIMKDDLDHYLKSGMDDYLLKPYREVELYSKLSDIWGFDQIMNVERLATEDILQNEAEFALYEFERFSGGNKQALAAILNSFVAESNHNIGMMLSSLGNNDYQTISALAHKMLTSFGHLKATGITEILRKLEQIESTPDSQEISLLVNEVAGKAYMLFPKIETKARELIEQEA
ncbi:MAG: ATP-binding protein [Bacteroidales bacterium]|nr:ATP-binding protein [Bacteroidales bacterium]